MRMLRLVLIAYFVSLAVLALDGRVVHAVEDRYVEISDPTYHAELSLISEYCRREHLFDLQGANTRFNLRLALAIHNALGAGGEERRQRHVGLTFQC